MKNTLIFLDSLDTKLNNLDQTTWTKYKTIGITNLNDLKEKIIEKLNTYNEKLNIDKIDFNTSITGLNQPRTYSGVINSGNQNNLAYVFIVPPEVDNRNGFIAQQIMPVLAEIIQKNLSSNSFLLSNLPVYVVTIDPNNLVPARAVSVIGSKILKFHYLDIFNQDEKIILSQTGINPKVNNIVDYDTLINSASSRTGNTYFDLDKVNKTIIFKIGNLKIKASQTNEPYYYTMKAYPALALAFKESYDIDITALTSVNANKTMNSFKDYVKKLKTGGNNLIQKIYYGAPGTGKSFIIDKFLKDNNISDEYIFRTTFHPEYTYSDFVGQILPNVSKINGNITYDLNKGIFSRAVEKAYQDLSENVYLILEEMSRGDCAAIFGDIFQLLDREKKGLDTGFSKYFINNSIIAKDVAALINDKVRIPPNLSILGTVNTSDQNVFVMDTAFKRRFDWEYVSTKPVPNIKPYLNNFSIVIADTNNNSLTVTWVDFYGVLNKFITGKNWLGLGEDKQIGQFFMELDPNSPPQDIKEKIQNKLLNFLWHDIHQASYKTNISLFNDKISNFLDLYDEFENDKNIFSQDFFNCINLWIQNKL